jgi:predicted permease
VTLSVMLVICAGLLIRSFARLQQVDPGIKPAHVLTFQLSLPATRYQKPQRLEFFQRLLAQLRALPGVGVAGATTQLPLTGTFWSDDSAIEGRPPDDYIVMMRHKTATPGYFDAAGLRILRGRDFADRDSEDAPRVVIINEALARRHFAHEDPIGRRITFAKPGVQDRWYTIVGVVEDERQDSLIATVQPEAYQPLAQDVWGGMHIVVRTDGDPEALIAPARQIVHALDAELVMQRTRTFDELVAGAVSPQRFAMVLMSAFAAVALLLAVVGVYGVVSYSVRQRTGEIGVRLALGASPRQVSRLIVAQSLAPVIAGVIAGLILASAATRLLAAQLFEVSPIDPATFSGVAIILLIAAVLASAIPARRAMRIDPVNALRAD